MTKQILAAAALSLAAFSAKAQTVVTDTVILGTGYVDQVWYSLANDEVNRSPKANWDLGFAANGTMSADILVNTTGSGAIWAYPKSDISGWSSVDTSGLSTWSKMQNAETEWYGALGRYADPSNPFDLGWGVYDLSTHIVSGDSIYIVKTQGGAFKKLFINQLAGSTYTFTYANLDGSDSTTSELMKTTYSGKNHGYFSLDTKTAVDREPDASDWDLTFCQWNSQLGGSIVTGVLQNDTVKVALAKVDPATRASYTNYAPYTFSTNINGIGYNWKTFTGSTYTYNDSSIYFVRTNNGDIWKMTFTNFISGASGNGSIIFTKQMLHSTTSIGDVVNNSNATVAVTPNPVAFGQSVSVVYNFEKAVNNASLAVYDITGRIVLNTQLENNGGLHAYTFATGNLSAGTYIVNVIADNQRVQQKFIVQ